MEYRVRRDERPPKKGVAIGFGIGSDCAMLFESESIDVVERTRRKGVSQSTKHGVSCGTWYIGRVQRIRKKDGNRVFDYHNDIDILDRPEGVEIQCCWYNRIKGKHMYKYDSTNHLFIQLESIIAMTYLSYNIKKDTYKLEESDHGSYEDFIKNLNGVKFSKNSNFSDLFYYYIIAYL